MTTTEKKSNDTCKLHSGIGTEIKNMKNKIEDADRENNLMWETVKSKVSLRLFMYMFGIIIAALMGLVGFQGVLLGKMGSIETSQAVMQRDISYIQMNLESLGIPGVRRNHPGGKK